MRSVIAIISTLLLSVTIGHTQEFSSSYWHKGVVDLEGGKTMNGKLKYDLIAESVQLVGGNNLLKSYTVENILAFEIMDAMTHRRRYFFSLPYEDENNYVKKHFFELLTEGNFITLMAREKIVEKVDATQNPYWGNTYNARRLVLEYDYFLIDQYGVVRRVDMRKRELAFYLMKDKREELIAFVDVNRLNIKDREDLIQVIDYYNQIKEVEAAEKENMKTVNSGK
ncbi:hypothetical protein [Algivirga pacifica]|uniref:Uncharacterized protein n=1 Tax=Algivirga pacifica TaxID=1162670 RepID=A0ABP9DA19_9BACT